MSYRDALRMAHAVLSPRSYVEIGCETGGSLTLARCPSAGIDPAYHIVRQLSAPTQLFRETSDAFFEAGRLAGINGGVFDLAFIDGLHLAEAALRDFFHLERHAIPYSVILIDDVLPADMAWTDREEAGRGGFKARMWTGDVYKLPLILRERRPDLEVEVFDIADKGMAVVSGLNPKNRSLKRDYREIEATILGGAFEAASAEELRLRLRPRPTDELLDHFTALARRRADPIAAERGRS